MARNRMKLLGAGLGVLGMITTLAGVAGADDFTSNASNPVASSTTVKVWVVATQDVVNGDVDHKACNIGSANNHPFVTASITSSDTSVAEVNPGSMTFSGCGDANSQDLTITVHPDLCLPKSATILIAESDRGPGNSVKGVFNTETINVQLAALNASDPLCGGGGGGGGGTTLCSEPAAPAWAAALLKASSGLKPKQAKDAPNYISEVAQHMTNGAVFEGITKSDQGGANAYANAVRSWMMLQHPDLALATVSSAKLIRPGWDCVSA